MGFPLFRLNELDASTLTPNVEVTGAARLYRAASEWTAGLAGLGNGNLDIAAN